MPIVLGKSKALVPRNVKVIKKAVVPEQHYITTAKSIAKAFGEQSKKMPKKKIIYL